MVFRSPVLRLVIATLAPLVIARLLQNRNDQSAAPTGTAAMTEAAAREVLGVNAYAGRDEILEAHRRLMKQLHPDQGGSHYFATRINQARDVLIKTAGVTLDNTP